MSLSVVIALLSVAQVNGNGSHSGGQSVFAGRAGPYGVWVQTVPAVGAMHLSIYLTESDNSMPISDARLQVSGTGPQGASQAVGPVLADAALGSPGWYGANVFITEVGEWAMTLVVQGSLGEGQAAFPVKVAPAGGISWVFVAALAVLLALAAWSALSLRRRKAV